jgi:hypothetical protein
MRKIYLANAFSLQMLDLSLAHEIKVTPLTDIDAIEFLSVNGWESAIGHEDTAKVVENYINLYVPYNRISISLKKGDILIVAQLVGGRLPEGSTTLPDGFSFKFIKVIIH